MSDESTRLTRYLMRAADELNGIVRNELHVMPGMSFPAAAAFAVASILAKVPQTQNYTIGALARQSNRPRIFLEVVIKAALAFDLSEPDQPFEPPPQPVPRDR